MLLLPNDRQTAQIDKMEIGHQRAQIELHVVLPVADRYHYEYVVSKNGVRKQ